MAPIYETDIAEERWSADVWKTYELWEKVERRFKRKRKAWLIVAGAAFVLLSSIPVLSDSMPKWRSLGASRVLATEISGARLRAARERQPMRVAVEDGDGGLVLRLERVDSCDSSVGETLEERRLFENTGMVFTALSEEAAREHGIPGVVRSYCHDPYRGGAVDAEGLHAFALLPADDLEEPRFDRMSVVIINARTGAVTID